MELSSVRALKEELYEPLGTRGGLQAQQAPSVSVPAEPIDDVARVLPGIALGIAPGRRYGDYALAVRVQHRDLLTSSRLDAIQRAARGEVDISYVGELTKQSATGHRVHTRPVRPGVSVGHYRITAGTLGAIVRVPGDDRARLLSNNHVLADENRGTAGDEILQPGRVDGGKSGADRIAELERFVALDANAANAVDAALALIDPDVEFDASIPGLALSGSVADVDDLPRVRKHGRTTGHTQGSVTAVEVDNVVVRFGIGNLRFDGQIEIAGDDEAFSRPGDSGSLIVDEASGDAVGLLFAGSDFGGPRDVGITYANPIEAVFSSLKVSRLW